MSKKRMNSMTAFMHHRRYITHLSGCIHKNKWSAAFGQWTIISTGCFSFSAFKIEADAFLSFVKQSPKNGFIHQNIQLFFQPSSSPVLKGFKALIPAGSASRSQGRNVSTPSLFFLFFIYFIYQRNIFSFTAS